MGLKHSSKDIWEGNFYTSAGASPGAGSFREESTLPQLLPPPSPPPKTEAKRHQKPYAKCNGDTTYNATLGSSQIRRCKTLGFLAVAARLPPKYKFQRHPFLYLSFPFRVILNLRKSEVSKTKLPLNSFKHVGPPYCARHKMCDLPLSPNTVPAAKCVIFPFSLLFLSFSGDPKPPSTVLFSGTWQPDHFDKFQQETSWPTHSK